MILDTSIWTKSGLKFGIGSFVAQPADHQWLKAWKPMFLFVNLRRSLADCSLDANRCFKFPQLQKRSGFSQVERYWHMVTWHADLIFNCLGFGRCLFPRFWMLRGNVIHIFAFGPRINFRVFLSRFFLFKIARVLIVPWSVSPNLLQGIGQVGPRWGQLWWSGGGPLWSISNTRCHDIWSTCMAAGK